jgi:hypothetical protein
MLKQRWDPAVYFDLEPLNDPKGLNYLNRLAISDRGCKRDRISETKITIPEFPRLS